jgi:hypothetical protein
MSHTLKDLVGQFDCVQRSLIFIYVGLEQGPRNALTRAQPAVLPPSTSQAAPVT